MASDEPSGARPGPVVLRIKLRYDDVDAMVQRFAPNVGSRGMFLPTRSLQPIGCELKFELRLADSTPVLVGLGRVKAVRAPDPDDPRATFGMAVELMRVTPQSRELILKMLERRRALGLPDAAIPMPADVDAARRGDLVDTGVTGAAAPVIPPVDAAPQVFTAPRRQSGPVAVAKAFAIEPLAPEPPRRRRAGVAEIIERASGPVAAVTLPPELDDAVDVGAALARARLLAGSDLDGELAALRDAAAAPLVEIGVEAASAELARQLGGVAVRRDRSQRWAPPPGVVVEPAPSEPAPAAAAPVRAPAPDASADVTPTTAVDDAPLPVLAAEASAADDELALERPPSAEPAPREGALEPAVSAEPEALEVEPEQISDEIHQLADGDFEEVEQTQIGEPVAPYGPDAFDAHAYATLPAAAGDDDGLADQLEADLAAAEAEAEADDLGFAEASAELAIAAAAAAIDNALRLDDDPFAARGGDDFVIPLAGPPAYEPVIALPDEAGDPGELVEIDDFEILAEADAADEDLLAMPRPAPVAAAAEPGERPSFADFASRLDFGDDSDFHTPVPTVDLDADGGPRPLSINQALASLDEADEPSDFGPLTAAPGFVPPDAFDQSDVIAVALPPPAVRAADDFDLETALEALDVDLDDLSRGPQGTARLPAEPDPRMLDLGGRTRTIDVATTRRPAREATLSPPTEPARVRRTPNRRAPRATTEDGILIDFDDDDE